MWLDILVIVVEIGVLLLTCTMVLTVSLFIPIFVKGRSNFYNCTIRYATLPTRMLMTQPCAISLSIQCWAGATTHLCPC